MSGIVRFPALPAAVLATCLSVALSVPVMGQDILGQDRGQTIAAPEKPVPAAVREGRRAAPAARRPSAQNNYTQVYLLRGLLNIFSLGMDDLARKLEQRGVRTSVHNHSEWETLAEQIAARYRAGNRAPVILVGHSLGADAVMFMSEYLGKQGVPVALVVPFDGTGSFAASANVQRVMNLTQRDYAHMRKGAGFRGELNNIDVSGQGYGHTDIDKSDRLHTMVINKITGILGRGGSRNAAPATSAPATPAPVTTAPVAPAPAPVSAAPAVGDVSASSPVAPAAMPAQHN